MYFYNKPDSLGEIQLLEEISTSKDASIPDAVKEEIYESIIKIWKRENPSVARFYNKKTNWYVQITKNPVTQYLKYGKVYGKILKNQYDSYGKDDEIYGVDKNLWKMVWFK
jgi:hypothetical protein